MIGRLHERMDEWNGFLQEWKKANVQINFVVKKDFLKCNEVECECEL